MVVSAGDPLPEPYATAPAAIGAEMARLALLCRRALILQRAAGLPHGGAPFDAAQAERELERLQHPPGRAPRLVDDSLTRVAELLQQRQRRNQRDLDATDPPPPLHVLRKRADLSPVAFDLFLLALLPEMDDGFGRLFALLSGAAPGRRRAPDVSTCARILTPDDVGAAEVRRLLGPGQPLTELGLLDLQPPDAAPRQAFAVSMATLLSVPAPVIAYILGQEVGDPSLRLFVRITRTALPRERTFVPAELFPRVAALLADRTAVPLLEGLAGAGKRRLLRALCAEQGRPLLEVDLTRATGDGLPGDAVAVVRLAWLLDAAVAVSIPGDPDSRGWQRAALEILARFPGPVALCRDLRDSGPTRLDLPLPPGRRLSPVEVPPPDLLARAGLWRDRLAQGGAVDELDFDRLARTYPITGGVIARVALEGRARARSRAADAAVTELDILRSIEAEFRPQMETVGRRLSLKARMEDLVLAAETRETLQELEATVRLRHKVLDDWGFGRLLRGRGVSALFYGEPGTGKTLAAGVIAGSAGLPLYQIDTAQVVSKWIGETEKNLRDVFRAAESGHAMLLFDEADALFGKRTDVNTSNDRYANLQTNFLLSEIELFNGVVILTTNRESVMDMAFQRRLSFRVHFPLPEEPEREELWRRMLRGHERPGSSIHYGELARRLRMSGGYIRNAVLRAAYLAAADPKEPALNTALLRHAAELVLRDAGKVI